MDLLAPLARALDERRVRYVVIGVGGANYWAHETFTDMEAKVIRNMIAGGARETAVTTARNGD